MSAYNSTIMTRTAEHQLLLSPTRDKDIIFSVMNRAVMISLPDGRTDLRSKREQLVEHACSFLTHPQKRYFLSYIDERKTRYVVELFPSQEADQGKFTLRNSLQWFLSQNPGIDVQAIIIRGK